MPKSNQEDFYSCKMECYSTAGDLIPPQDFVRLPSLFAGTHLYSRLENCESKVAQYFCYFFWKTNKFGAVW